MRGPQHPPRIRGDFSLHLLAQIEMLRGDISHEQLSKRLGDVTERYFARYVAGKVHLLERDFYQLAKALSICPRVLAEQWAVACGLRMPPRLSDKSAVEWIRQRAYSHWRQHSRIAWLPANRVPPDLEKRVVKKAVPQQRMLRFQEATASGLASSSVASLSSSNALPRMQSTALCPLAAAWTIRRLSSSSLAIQF